MREEGMRVHTHPPVFVHVFPLLVKLLFVFSLTSTPGKRSLLLCSHLQDAGKDLQE